MSISEYDKAIKDLQEKRKGALEAEQIERSKGLEADRAERDRILRMNGATSRPLFSGLSTIPFKVYAYGAVIVLILVLAYCGVKAIQRDAKGLGVAEEKERTAKVEDKAVTEFKQLGDAEVEERAQQRAELAKQNAKRDVVKTKRNVAADKAIGKVTAPKPPLEVAKDVKDILGIEPSMGPDTLSYTSASIQGWVALKLDRDRLSDNLADTTEQLKNKQHENELLELDNKYKTEALVKTEQQAKDWRDVAMSYKTVAKKTGWQKFLGFGQKVGEIVLTALVVGVVVK